MLNELADLKTKPSLLASLQRVKDRKLSSGEIMEQRVSFVYSAMKKSGVTREHVRNVILEQVGEVVEGKS